MASFLHACKSPGQCQDKLSLYLFCCLWACHDSLAHGQLCVCAVVFENCCVVVPGLFLQRYLIVLGWASLLSLVRVACVVFGRKDVPSDRPPLLCSWHGRCWCAVLRLPLFALRRFLGGTLCLVVALLSF